MRSYCRFIGGILAFFVIAVLQSACSRQIVTRQPAHRVGFIDKSGKLVITVPDLIEGGEFHDGLAPVCVDHPVRTESDLGLILQPYGFIDHSGRFVITPRYGDARNFSEGLAAVLVGVNHYSYVDPHGFTKFSVNAERVGDFHNGLAMVIQNGRRGYVDKSGRLVIPSAYDDSFENDQVLNFNEELIGYQLPPSEGMRVQKFGFMNRDQRVILPPIFECGDDFSESVAPVEVIVTVHGIERRLWGYITHQGRFSIRPRFVSAFPFREGLALVAIEPRDKSDPPRWTFVDHKGHTLPTCWGYATQFSEGLAAVGITPSQVQERKMVADERPLFGYVDKCGDWRLAPTFYVAKPFSEGCAFISKVRPRDVLNVGRLHALH